MKSYNNEKGFALITALMITMICLVMIMGIMTTITQNTRSSGINKTYQNAIDASYGGADLAIYEMLPILVGATDLASMQTLMNSMSFASFVASKDCMYDKLTKKTADWGACAANSKTTDPKSNPDYNVTLQGTSGTTFTVHSKIVDTNQGVPYVAGPKKPLGGGGVASQNNLGSNMYLSHYVYRVEVATERTLNPTEQGAVSVLYEY
jgi:hypothetical protein